MLRQAHRATVRSGDLLWERLRAEAQVALTDEPLLAALLDTPFGRIPDISAPDDPPGQDQAGGPGGGFHETPARGVNPRLPGGIDLTVEGGAVAVRDGARSRGPGQGPVV